MIPLMNTQEVANKEEISISRQISIVLADRHMQPMAVKADKNGNPPSTIEILKVGIWRTPYHGDFMITPEDLTEYVAHFEAGIGLAAAGNIGAPIDYSHNNESIAAGWMKSLRVEGDTLVADVEWTPKGAQVLTDGEMKCFSPEFCPKSRGGWLDPQDSEHVVENVLLGGGLTNIPLFSGLKPIMASSAFGKDKDNVFFISASSEIKETTMPTLDEVLAKDVSAFTDEDKAVIESNKDTLTDEQKTKLGIEIKAEETPAPAPTPPTEEPAPVPEPTPTAPVPEPVAASIKSGESVVIKASELKVMQETTEAYRKEKAEQKVLAHAKRGAIKADAVEKWTNRLMADASIEEDMAALPSHASMADEIGTGFKSGTAMTALEEITKKADEAIKASKEAGTELSTANAISQVRKENPELAAQYDNEIREGN